MQLLNSVGIQNAVSYAQKLNVGTPPSVPSLALGASDVTLISLTAAYGAFANGGTVRQPVLIRRVEDSDGAVLYTDQSTGHRAVSESTAFLMSSMLADVINSGTAFRARQAGFTLPAAGKTGTTNAYVDAWFVGFTPHLVTGVWIGFDQPETIVANGYAGELAVPLWASFMKTATKGDKPDWIARPSNVVGVNVCRVSGQLPNAGCTSVEVVNREGATETKSMVYTEYYVAGTQPTAVCLLHPSPSFMDRLAGLFGGGPDQIPIGADQAGLPPGRAGTTGVVAHPTPAPEVHAEDSNAEPKAERRQEETRVLGPALRQGGQEDRRVEEERRGQVDPTCRQTPAAGT